MKKLLLGYIGLLLVSGCTSEERISLKIENDLAVLDGFTNSIYFFDLDTRTFLKDSINFEDGDKFRSKSFALAPNGNLYVTVNAIESAFTRNSSYIGVINPMTLEVVAEIEMSLAPQDMVIAENGMAYITHGVEYEDGSGWILSVLDTNTNTLVSEIIVPGAPKPPKLLEDGKVYVTVFGGGKGHFGNSNVMMIDPETNEVTSLFPEDFSEVPARDLILKDETYYVALNGNTQDEAPYFLKPIQWTEAAKTLIYFKTPDDFSKIDLDINGTDMRVIVDEHYVYVLYVNSVEGKGGGLLVFDLEAQTVLEDFILDDETFSKEMLDSENFIYITDPTRNSLTLFDKAGFDFENFLLPEGAYPEKLLYLP